MKERGRLSKEEILDMPLGSLITTISRSHMAFLFSEIEKLGIGGQFQFLMGLAREDGIIQEELASRFHLNESTIARALRKLEDAGMVQREVDENNRRRKIITVTEKGRAAVDAISEIDKKWEERVQSLSLDEKNKLKEMLQVLAVESMELMYEFRKGKL
ncbi:MULTISPECIES: MarR family winged helix-turn-helix transcriptional regulator [Methanobacterium]|uniref:MarR family transcriptional regulator n=1 Tax=Methanobacterium veterum TaxID=408577 RepID=A0A9E5A390_9EURY|nr:MULTISPECIES: MarR family transcriptional regulator [Methanobacterium]MCZ3364537.1 MarR family transcriptional regulator [Methanobacterium veterum]MCZ3372291.1 MarR family transcriptional regulator [Methanobacterium veterum]